MSIELLRGTDAFQSFDDEQLNAIAGLLRPMRFEAGQAIVREGDPADCWYLVADGSASVTHRDLTGQSLTLALLGPGQSFGERALIDDPSARLRTATVSAVTAVEALALDRADVQRAVQMSAALAEQARRRLDVMAIDAALKRASPFASLPHDALWALASTLPVLHAVAGQQIVRQGDAGDAFYLIRSGRVQVLRNGRRISVLGAGDSFGEVALLTDGPRNATVSALDDTELLVLTRDAYQAVARQHASVANHFREIARIRFSGASGQRLLLPDPLTTIMPLVSARRHKRYWVVLLVGVLLFALLTVAAQQAGTRAAVYAALVVGSLIGPAVFVMYLAESHLLSERPLELTATAILGAALGLPAAILLQRQMDLVPGSPGSALLIALIEEPAKVLGVVWILKRPTLRFRIDGLIFGAAAGMGFAAIEMALYAVARLDTVGALLGVLWFRALLSPFTHGTWTAIVCATIWRERERERQRQRERERAGGCRRGGWRLGGYRRDGWWRGGWKMVAVFGTVVVLHALWDWRALPLPWNFVWLVCVGVASVLLLRALLEQAVREEARSVAALAPEIGSASATAPRTRCAGCKRRAPAGAHYCPRCGLALRQAHVA